jgi:ubiquinone biosynthesis protein UbiJ
MSAHVGSDARSHPGTVTGQIEVDGDLVKLMVALFQIFAPDARESTLSRIVGWCRRYVVPGAPVAVRSGAAANPHTADRHA